MISLIICSARTAMVQGLQQNIAETIGVPFEIITINNTQAKRGICKVYNEGGEKAKFDILCFVHEDVLFATQNWGEKICRHFEDNHTGLIGFAGGDAKSAIPGSWSIPLRSTAVNVIQHSKKAGVTPSHKLVNPTASSLKTEMAVLDGFCLFTTRAVFQLCKFNERLLGGFHGYDIDYSLQVGQKFSLYVVYDIIVHHFSEGRQDREWLRNVELVNNHWAAWLPLSVYRNVSKQEWNYYYWRCLQVYLKKLKELNFSQKEISRAFIKFSFTKQFRVRRFLSMSRYVLKMFWAGRAL